MLQPLNVKPGPPIYVEEAQVHVPGQKRGSTLRLVLLGLVFTFVSVLLCRYIFTLTSPYSCNKGGGMGSIDTSVMPEQVEHERLQEIHDDDWHYDVPSDLVMDNCVSGSEWTKDGDHRARSY